MKKLKIYVIILFVVALAAGAYWVFTNNRHNHEAHEHSDDVYTCSMHPQITSDHPGNCPICGMDLVKKSSLGNHGVDTSLGGLLLSPNTFVIGDYPTVSPIDTTFQTTLSLPGEVAYNPNTSVNIAAKVGGRIEKLYVNYLYQPIQKGQKLFDLYSPELLTEQQNYLYLLQNDAGNTSLIKAAAQKLLLYGMTEAQVQQLAKTQKTNPVISIYSPATGAVQNKTASPTPKQPGMAMNTPSSQELGIKTGMYVTKGETVFRLLSTNRVWAIFYLLDKDLATVKEGLDIGISSESNPKEFIKAKTGFIETQITDANKSIVMRVEITNTQNWPIGLRLTGTLKSQAVKGMWLPKEAVINLGSQSAILVAENNGFKVTYVKTGIITDNYIQLLNLPDPHIKMAQNAQYLFDSESFITK